MGLFGRSKKKKDSKGVQTLVELFTTGGILYPSEYMDRAAQELRKEKSSGSRALAGLIAELLACRSEGIRSALIVAQEVSAIPELIEVVRSVASASETTSAPIDCSFTPEIVGAGKVGWTSGTYSKIKEVAADTLDILSGVKTQEDVLRQREEAEKDVEALIKTLQHKKDPPAQNKAALALGEIGDPRAVGPLIQALKDENDFVRLEAAEALGKIKDARAVKPLTQALKDEYEWVRFRATVALGKIGSKAEEAVPALAKALKDEYDFVREEAAEALGEIGDARAVEPLTKALKDEEEEVQEAAQEALEKIKAK